MEKTKILVIEDREEDRQLVSNYLKSKGFEVIMAKNGFEGVYLFDKEAPSLVILDWNMPGATGTEVCKNIKKKKNHVPILVLTIHNNLENKRRSFEAGCDDFLSKPADLEELGARVQALLKNAHPKVEGKLEYGDLVIDREAHRVMRAGKPVELSVTEYTLLEYLMENIDKVLTRKMILEHVWGTSNPETFTNIVDVYVNYLRKKVDVPGRRSLVKTVRGFGYMLEDLSHRKAA